MTESEFDEYWPLISAVYTKIGGLLLQQNGEVQVQKYECRLRKSKKGGKPPPRGVKKCYGKTVRVPGLCDVRINTTRTVSAPVTITIQRLYEYEHRHTLERSREIAPSTKTETGEHGVIVDNWMHLVASTVEPLIDVLPEEIVKMGDRLWEL